MSSGDYHFTVYTNSGSGLGDQLGTQFARLYGLGKTAGGTFVYSPLYFHRSVKPRWQKILDKIFFSVRYFFLFVCGQGFLSGAVNALLLNIEKYVDAVASKSDSPALSSFLGLEQLTEATHGNTINGYIDIDIETLILCGTVQNLNDFKAILGKTSEQLQPGTGIAFRWTAKMWSLIPQIDSILTEAGLPADELQQTVFTDTFNDLHSIAKNNKSSIVFHIRCGDSTRISLGARSLIVYDKFIYASEKEMTEILKIDPYRISVPPEQYLHIYQKIAESIDRDKTDVMVISDGYELTYSNLLRNLLKRKCNFLLDSHERKILKQYIHSKNDIFKSFANATVIVGESEENLLQSIKSIAGADILIWGCGGFATNIHRLFKPKDKNTIVSNVNECDASVMHRIIQNNYA